MKKCPFCAEEIQDEAVKCKHCGEFLIDAELKGLKKDTGGKWYYTTPMIILWILLLQPLALPIIWKNPQYDITRKIIWTVVTIIVTVLITLWIMSSFVHYLNSMVDISMKGL
jgi:predicted nucleic acid-binding Zn ribbon protein